MSYHDLSVGATIASAIHHLPCTSPPPRHRLRHLQRGNPSRMLHCHRRHRRHRRHRIPHLWALQQHANAKKAFSKSVAVMGLPIGALHLDAETANSWSSIAAFVVLISAVESTCFAGDRDRESHARLRKIGKTRVPSFRLDGVALRKIDPTSVITCLRSSRAARLWPPDSTCSQTNALRSSLADRLNTVAVSVNAVVVGSFLLQTLRRPVSRVMTRSRSGSSI